VAVDRVTPLATPTQMEQSNLRHLIVGLEEEEKRDLMVRATRACESYTSRRLAPFEGLVENHRAEGSDVDEGGGYGLAGDLAAQLGMAHNRAFAASGSMVRHCWLREFAPIFQDMWEYSDVRVALHHSIGSTDQVGAFSLIGDGPEPDTGHLWFRLGVYLPIGSRVRVTYSGGYKTVPGDLVQACRLLAAADVVDEDNFPRGSTSTKDERIRNANGDGGFTDRAHKILDAYKRSGGG
jgi:hypothetical protein